MKKITRVVAIVLLLAMASQASAQMTQASLIIRLIKPLLEKAITAAVPAIQESGPFISAVILFLEKKPDYAASSFIEGLVNNNIMDPATVALLLNAIKGVSAAAYVGLTLAGQGEAAGQIAEFANFMNRSPTIDRWAKAVAAGDKVRVVNNEIIIESAKPAPSVMAAAPEPGRSATQAQQASAPTYVQSRPDEVMPLLNIIHNSPGATILLDDEVVTVSKFEEYMFQNLPAGKHVVTIRTKYAEGRAQIFVNPARKTDKSFDQIEIKLARGSFVLDARGSISGISIYMDGKYAGSTPFRGTVPAGAYLLEMKSEWIDAYSAKIEGKAGDSVVVEPKMTIRGAVALEGDFPGSARAEIDGVAIASTLGRIYLPSGNYRLGMSDETMYPYEVEFSVYAGSATRLKIEPRFRTGTLAVSGISAALSAAVDGQPLTANDDGTWRGDLVIGQHALSALCPWKKDEPPVIQRITITEGGSSRVELPSGEVLIAGLPIDALISYGNTRVNSSFTYDPAAGSWRSRPLLPGKYKFWLGGEYIRERDIDVEISLGKTSRIDAQIVRTGKVRIDAAPGSGIAGRIERIQVDDLKGARIAHEYSSSATFTLPAGEYLARVFLAGDTDAGTEQRFAVESGKTKGPLAMKAGYSAIYLAREKMTRISGLEAEKAQLQGRLGPIARQAAKQRSAATVFLLGGFLSTGAGLASYMLGNQTSLLYENAKTSAKATGLREKIGLYSQTLTIGLVAGGGCLVMSGLIAIGVPKTSSLEASIASLDAEIAKIKGGR
jgi:hypothetical protein